MASHMCADFIQGTAGGLAAIHVQNEVVADGLYVGVIGGNSSRLAVETTLGMPLVNDGCGRLGRSAKHLAVGAGSAVDNDQFDGAGHNFSSCRT